MSVLARLVDLHDRLTTAGVLTAPGYAMVRIGYVVVLDRAGGLVEIEVTQDAVQRGKTTRLMAREFALPAPVTRTVQIAPNLLWDTPEYALGLGKDAEKSDPKTALRFASFRAAALALSERAPEDEGLAALAAFLSSHDPAAFAQSATAGLVEDRKLNVSFRLEDEERLIAERPAVVRLLQANGDDAEAKGGEIGQCLVTGTVGPIARLHPAIKGVAGAQSTGARLISCNLPAFESHGLTQGNVSPVSESAAAAIGRAMNWLLRSDSPHRIRLGETATTVLWATGDTPVETLAATLFGDEGSSEETERERLRLVQAVRDTLTAAKTGAMPEAKDIRVCQLTIAPNAARLAIAGWQERPLVDVAEAILQWFADLDIVRPKSASAAPAILTLLRSLAPLGDLDRIPARLGQSLFEAALGGGCLPDDVLVRALQRLRADRTDPHVPYDGLRRARQDACRLSLIKVYLIRNCRWRATVALDPSNTDPAYRLGRVFRLLEQGQQAAVKSNLSLSDQYFASASAMPGRILPMLIAKFRKAHKRSIDGNLGHWIDNEIGKALDDIEEMPGTLSMQEQGRFALGYYHQRAPKPKTVAQADQPKEVESEEVEAEEVEV